MRQVTRLVALGYFVVVVVTALLQVTGVARFTAPIAILPAPARPPIEVSIVVSSEQQEWIAAAARQFAAREPTVRGRPVQLILRAQGSQAMLEGIVQERSQPVAIIPAGSSQLAELARAWAARNPNASIVAADGPNKPQPVALSPLVLVGWHERMALLFPADTLDLWRRLHDALISQGWATLGGQAAWGPVKLGHASPRSANSGVETLTLLAYAYHNKARDLTLADVSDAAFQRWLVEVESGVTDFPDSSDALFTAFLQKGPSSYDLVVVYENQAVRGIERARQLWGAIQVIYPPATSWSDHPFTVLEAPWITPEQQEAARLFRDFLLSEEAQRLALQYGFRPANASVPLNADVPGNPFPAAASAGVRPDTPGSVAPPPPEVIEALVSLWEQQVRR